MHALWNAVVKGSTDRAITIGLIAIGNALFGIVLAFFAAPLAPESWIYIVLTILVHLLYFVFLIAAYRLGDFSKVYPIARGIAPVLVATGSMIFVGEYLPVTAWMGVLIVSFAIGFLVISNNTSPTLPAGSRVGVELGVNASAKAVWAAVLTGVCIAAYTIIDGLGVRTSQSPLGYIGWSFGLQIFLGLGFVFYRRKFLSLLGAKEYLFGILGGFISGLAYALAIYAMSLTTLGSVSAIRESSVIIAALIGVIWFGERPWKSRIVAAIMVAIGVYLIAS